MAEIMILLLFCLLIALATFLSVEQAKRADAETRLRDAQTDNEADRALLAAIKGIPELSERLKSAAGPE
jgi:hypothetical protein